MTTAADDDQAEQRRSGLWRPIVSALAVMAGVAFALAYGIASIPPFIALFLVGAFATVLFRLAEMLRSRFDNFATAGLSAVALMVSMLANVAMVAWVVWFMLSAPTPNPVQQFLSAKDVDEQVLHGTRLAIPALLAVLGLTQISNLWRLVRANAFGARAHEK